VKRIIKVIVVFVMVFSVFVLQFPLNFVRGDSGPVYKYGINVVPYQESDVRLASESLSIEIKEDKDMQRENAFVDAYFVFVNEGNDKLVRIGFPFGVKGEVVNLTPRDVKVKVNGKVIEMTHIEDQSAGEVFDPWTVFDVSFKKDETKTVEVSYTGVSLGGRFVYILKTGKYWKGPIGTLDITIKFPHAPVFPYLVSLKPDGYRVVGNNVIYHLKDFEPSQNIEIEFLPEAYYRKIKPFKDRAEQTNNPNDWLNYVLALLPENPYGLFMRTSEGGFVNSFKTSNFQDYVLGVFDKAIDLQKEGSVEKRVLLSLKVPRESPFFKDGLANFSSSDIMEVINRSLSYFMDDIENPKNSLEGKMIAYLLEYKVCADFQHDFSLNGIVDSDTLFDLASKYFSKKDLDIVPYINFNLDTYKSEPLFMECFIPNVEIKNLKILIRYNLPYSMQKRIIEFNRTNSTYLPDENMSWTIEEFPPYEFVVTVDLSSIKNDKDLELRKQNIKRIISNEMEIGGGEIFIDAFLARFLSTYLYDILDNLSFKGGGIYFIKRTIDCTPKINKAISELDSKMQIYYNYKNKFNNTVFERIYIEETLNYLSNSKDLLVYAKAHPLINFVQYKETKSGYPKIVLIVLSIIAILFFIFFKKSKK